MPNATRDLVNRLRQLSSTSLIDAQPGLRVLPATMRPIVPRRRFAGTVRTAQANRDLMSVMAALRESVAGEVLVIDVGGQDRAVAGELFATEAQRRGLAAVVIHGRCRDSATLANLSIPLWATGFAPNAYPARALPVTGVDLVLEGVPLAQGELIVGDDDGLVVGSGAEFASAVDAATAIEKREKALQQAILGGASLFDSLNYDEHLAALRAGAPGGLTFS
ncbi:RraA family protein [Nostocoides sp.]|jgi:4-hydroxy-4-methyl-2-oxoglutarate aldolase|uniref:RraA family protein n=1 Tax=Nostocoides sp. TaxID=1917966 RepID=UPI002C0CEBFD|nr:RraA family protein [Tetrasphaera sp.]